MAVVCFDLIPEALEISQIAYVIIGVLVGIVTMIYCDLLVQRKFNIDKVNKKGQNSLLKTGIIVSIGLAIHNIPEGLAIGSGFEASIKLGLGLAIAICLHDVPEGISMAVPMKNGGMNICCFIRDSNRYWSFNWSNSRFIISKNNFNLFKFRSRSNALYSFSENYYLKPTHYIVVK